jgi:transposase
MKILFLPGYSPELNPIEQINNYIKMKRKNIEILKDKTPNYQLGLKILKNLPER